MFVTQELLPENLCFALVWALVCVKESVLVSLYITFHACLLQNSSYQSSAKHCVIATRGKPFPTCRWHLTKQREVSNLLLPGICYDESF